MDPRIRRAILALPLSIVVAALLGGPGCRNAAKPSRELAPPRDVRALNGDNVVTVSWTASPDESRSDFGGYYVYRWVASLADTSADRLDRYRVGIARRTAASFADDLPITNGQNGIRYYYHIRSKGEAIGAASNEVIGIGRPEGAGMVIREIAGNTVNGFNLSLGDSITLRSDNPDMSGPIDFYLGTTDSRNDSAFDPVVKSPSTLAYANSEWSTIVTGIAEIGTRVEDWALSTGAEPTEDLFPVTLHHVYAMKTRSGNYGKIQITGIVGAPGGRVITFKYAYQTTPGLYLF